VPTGGENTSIGEGETHAPAKIQLAGAWEDTL